MGAAMMIRTRCDALSNLPLNLSATPRAVARVAPAG